MKGAFSLLLALTVSLPAHAWPDGPAAEALQRKPDRTGNVVQDEALGGASLLARNGDLGIFATRPHMPLSSWKVEPTAFFLVDVKDELNPKLVRKVPTKLSTFFHPDPKGRWLATQESDAFRVYDVKTGAVLAEATGANVPGYHDEWSPDGTKIAFEGKRANEKYVWDIGSKSSRLIRKNRLARFLGHSWSPDSKRLAFIEESGNPLTLNQRVVRVMNADVDDPQFGEVTHEIKVEKAVMKSVTHVHWGEKDTLIAWNRDGAGTLYREAVIDLTSGQVIGTGSAKDLSVDDTDDVWVYHNLQTGEQGDFETIFKRKHPTRQHPLPLPLEDKMGPRRSTKYRVLDDGLVVWERNYAKWRYDLVATRDGTPLFSFENNERSRVTRAGAAVRAVYYSGAYAEWDVKPAGR
jgi:hypothetical protein